MCMCGDVVVYNTCINAYCLQGDYFYGRILYLRFCLLKYINKFSVVFVKLFVQHSEFNS